MKKLAAALLVCLSLAGCTTSGKLPAQAAADFVEIKTEYGPGLARKDLREKERVDALVAYVNALPNKWGVPWYGPPVGKVSFRFHRNGRYIGRFYVGPVFFGRGNFSSQRANRRKIEEVGRIADIDLWAYITTPETRPTTPAKARRSD